MQMPRHRRRLNPIFLSMGVGGLAAGMALFIVKPMAGIGMFGFAILFLILSVVFME